ncbi:MAG: alpha-L-arabinofuranosidase C-terminal domain-containing protein, partial [Woeseiaceae bacterium]
VYEGIWVGEDSKIPNIRGIRKDVVEALRRIHVPVVRWPGGCYAEIYDWRDAVGPQADRPVGINTAWGDEPESNAFGSHEFFDFLGLIGAKAFISVNVASGSPQLAKEWLDYLTAPQGSGPGRERAKNGHPEPFDVAFIGIGNETWGCGGNMRAEYYADLYRQYYAVLHRYGTLVASDANSDQYGWTRKLLERAMYRDDTSSPLAWINKDSLIRMMGLHFYTFSGNDWADKSPAVGFSEKDWARSMQRTYQMETLLSRHISIMDEYDPDRTIGLSVNEWGAWWARDENQPSNLYQENTLRDAVIAALTLNIFQQHADRVQMANIAQMVNVLQSMILTHGDEMLLTPTYHVFDLYQVHRGARHLPAEVTAPHYVEADADLPALSASASRNADGVVHLSLVNLDPRQSAKLVIAGLAGRKTASGKIITADEMDAHPTFGQADPLVPRDLAVHAAGEGRFAVALPPKSVSVIAFAARR